MSLKKMLRRVAPGFVVSYVKGYRNKKDIKALQELAPVNCDSSNLKSTSAISLTNIFKDKVTDVSWSEQSEVIEKFKIPDFTGGVNPGDRRAIHYLVRYFKPESVLEIGTHIGASTVHIATALHQNNFESKNKVRLTTLDILDVNSEEEQMWLQYGTQRSPRQMMEYLGYNGLVDFQVGNSMTFMEDPEKHYDLIFLDGDHAATTVYKEVPKALKRLNPGGLILLHDYFPGGKSLWTNGDVHTGPYLAIQKHNKEGAKLKVIPLGELPWPTKLGSNVTSLALLTRDA